MEHICFYLVAFLTIIVCGCTQNELDELNTSVTLYIKTQPVSKAGSPWGQVQIIIYL